MTTAQGNETEYNLVMKAVEAAIVALSALGQAIAREWFVDAGTDGK